MARVYGQHYPERKLMAVISDMLGIDHFSTARGSTVRKDFLRAVAAAVGVPDYMSYNKDPLLAAIVEHVTGNEMDSALFSSGTTITDEALQAIINGIVENGFLPSLYDPDESALGLALSDAELADVLDPGQAHPPDIRRQLVQAHRDEHDTFRQILLRAYSGRCGLTGAQVPLRAVHVIPPNEGGPDLVTNGILLRADLAALFENGLLALDETHYTVLLHPQARGPSYDHLVGRRLRDPAAPYGRPAEVALEWRRQRAGL